MQILQRFSNVFRNKIAIGNRHEHLAKCTSPSELTSDLERQLYGMGMQEQSIVRHILNMAGYAVLVQEDTFATDKKNKPYYFEKGRKVRISEDPLTFDRQGDVRINILDESDHSLSMRLSDYIHDIYANR
jgi:hypothetical protein